MLPLWAQWTFGVSTVVLTAIAIWFAARSKQVAAESKRLSEWQRHNKELTDFKQRLEQRVGYAHAMLGTAALSVVAQQFPRSPGEPPDDREARRQQPAANGDGTGEDFESLVFTQQSDGRWTLEMLWGSYPSIEAAFVHAALKYQLPARLPPKSAQQPLDLWSAGPRYLLVTRPAGTGAPD